MVSTAAVTEMLGEKMPESAWHSEKVDELKELLKEAVKDFEGARVIRDIFFEFGGRRYAPDIAIILKGALPVERIGTVYRLPEDGPLPMSSLKFRPAQSHSAKPSAKKRSFTA